MVSDDSTAFAWKSSSFKAWIQWSVHPCQRTIIDKHLVIVPCTEVITFAYILVISRASLFCTIVQIVQEEVDITDSSIVTQCRCTTQRSFTSQSGIYRTGCHVITIDIVTSDTATATCRESLSTYSCFIELVQIISHFTSTGKWCRSGKNTFRFLIQVVAGT